MAAIADKHQSAGQTTKSRVLLAGGSNLAFGVDSKRLEDSLGLPVFNLGLHGGLGVRFMLNEVSDIMRKGDKVVLSIEYLLDADGDYKLKKLTSDLFPPAKQYYSFSPLKEAEMQMDGIRDRFNGVLYGGSQTSTGQTSDEIKLKVYTRSAFNRNGDVVAHLQCSPPDSLTGRESLLYRYWEGISLVNDFAEEAGQRGVEVVYVFPCLARKQYEVNRTVILRFADDIKQDLSVSVLCEPDHFVFEDSLFFDTVYHLRKNGREIRTDKLIEILKTRF